MQPALVKPLITSCLAALTMAAVWFTLSAQLDAVVAWFALIAALDIALLERWTRSKNRSTAAWVAPVFTLVCCFASLWLITALSVRNATGFNLIDIAKQMGIGLFAQLLHLRLTTQDWILVATSPILAYFLANVGNASDRHQSI
jgi:hypothetical protein